jgi:hypothetical protein
MGVYKQGEYIKIEVRDETSGQGEWMWMLVDHCDDERRLVFGRLRQRADRYEGHATRDGFSGQFRKG